jgi:hypothetical protein
MYDYVVLQDVVVLRAVRLGLRVCLPFAVMDAPLRGLKRLADVAELQPQVKLAGGRFTAYDLLWLQQQARTPVGQHFKETLFFLSISPMTTAPAQPTDAMGYERRWWRPAQERSWGRTQAKDLDARYGTVCLELHTHPPGASHFSATDDAEEHGLRLYALLENPDGDEPLIRVRASVYGQRIEIPAVWVFDLPSGWRDPVGEAVAQAQAGNAMTVGVGEITGGAA